MSKKEDKKDDKKEENKEDKKEKGKNDEKKKNGFLDKALGKVSDELGLSTLGTNGGLMHQGKWEQLRNITIPEGIKSLDSSQSYRSGKCWHKFLLKNFQIILRKISTVSPFHKEKSEELLELVETNLELDFFD